MEIINKAIAHITEQMMKEPNNTAIVEIEEHLTKLCKNESIARKLLAEGKTLQGALKEIENRAREIAKIGAVCIGPQEGFALVERYYDITEADKTEGKVKAKSEPKLIDVTDFL